MPQWEGTRGPDVPAIALQDILQMHVQGVEELEITGGLIGNWNVLLVDFKSLLRLRLENSRITDGDLSCLVGVGKTFPCPKLAHLELYAVQPITTRVIKEIASARKTSGSPLATVELRGWFKGWVIDADVADI